jgi:hypothetical protein
VAAHQAFYHQIGSLARLSLCSSCVPCRRR